MAVQKMTRRQFLVGCSAAIASLAGARLTQLAFAAGGEADATGGDILVQVFLRGGWDALNAVPPIAGPDRGHYQTARPEIQVPAAGNGAALPLNGLLGFHPALAPLYDLYQQGHLAVVHACGLNSDTRSHFDAMQYMELGTPGVKTTPTGWITRHLQSAPNLPGNILIPALSAGSGQADSLRGSNEAVAMSDPGSFDFGGHWQYENAQRQALRHMYAGETWLFQAGTTTLDTLDLIENANPGNYQPANGASYPGGSFGRNLQTIAQMIKMDMGLRVATVDLGGWDTHENQGDGSGGYLAGLLGTLAQGLAALFTDLDGPGGGYTRNLTLVLMSEFGRRLKENANQGTDHGHGSVMMVLGGAVNGGQVYGPWPGLATEQLYDRADLAVASDYRQVLGEILTRRLGNPNLDIVFPGYSAYQPLGIVRANLGTTGYNTFIPVVTR